MYFDKVNVCSQSKRLLELRTVIETYLRKEKGLKRDLLGDFKDYSTSVRSAKTNGTLRHI